jgi:hypothetical protein
VHKLVTFFNAHNGRAACAFSTLVLSVAFAGLSQAASTVKPVPGAGRIPDAQVEHNIQVRFAKSKVNADHFTVSVHNGVARIDGRTNVIQHKGVATRLAKAGGATAVQNRIQISEEARAKAAERLQQNRTGEPVARAAVVPPPKSK